MPYKRTGKPTGRPKKPPLKRGERPPLSDNQRKALKFELKHLESFDGPVWGPSLRRVAAMVGVTHSAVAKWRNDPAYVQGLIQLAAEQCGPEAAPEDTLRPKRTKRQADAALHVYLKENWPGPTVSLIDGTTYNDPESYFKHIQENPDVQWVDDFLPPHQPKKKSKA